MGVVTTDNVGVVTTTRVPGKFSGSRGSRFIVSKAVGVVASSNVNTVEGAVEQEVPQHRAVERQSLDATGRTSDGGRAGLHASQERAVGLDVGREIAGARPAVHDVAKGVDQLRLTRADWLEESQSRCLGREDRPDRGCDDCP